MPPLARKALAELVGSALLVAGVVGSGVAATQLSPDDVGLQLLENAAATVGVLVALILALGPVSGAHLNPVVTLADRWFGGVTTREAVAYVPAQLSDTFAGIAPSSVPAFVAAQLVGAALAVACAAALYPSLRGVAPAVVVPHQEDAA